MSVKVALNEPAPQLNGFLIEKRLGSGTYACVYKATPKNAGADAQPVAIKCIKKSSLNKASTENLLREIKILKNIKHEFIVQLKDFQWDDNFIYLIMEYCAGGDLSQFIKSRRTIPEKYVRRFVQQIACALKHLRANEIAHMDLKPQNILLTSANNPSLKLADFGFAQYMRGDNVSRSLRGSPLYMAPEILKNKVYDSKVDLWSVGVILHEVIFGYAPFVSNSLEELEKKIMDDSPIEFPTHIMLSETCKDLLRRLLQRNPAERISFDEFFNHPFVDLEHMAGPDSLKKANELLKKAVRYDQSGDYLLAQKYYLQSIEYLIPAIQFEKDSNSKQEIRDKANKYLKRAEEIADIANGRTASGRRPSVNEIESKILPLCITEPNPSLSEQAACSWQRASTTPRMIAVLNRTQSNESNSSQQVGVSPSTLAAGGCSPSTPGVSIPIVFESTGRPKSNSTSSGSSSIGVSSLSIDLLKMTENNPNVNYAIKMCLDADDKIKNSRNIMASNRELVERYQNAIAILLPFVKDLPKDEFSKTLRSQISKWLSNAERLKAEESQQQMTASGPIEEGQLVQARNRIKDDNDEESSLYNKACIMS